MSGLVVDRVRVDGREVAFDAPPGAVVALLGGPGSGASAVLEAVAGLRRAEGGRALLDGEPVRPARIGVMQQPARLFPELTAAENVAVPLLARGLPAERDRIERTLASLALGPAVHHNLVEQLSGGQQQRVAVARALITGCPLLCLDEPVTELDEASVEVVWAALRAAADAGAVVVVATADRDLAGRCDRVVAL